MEKQVQFGSREEFRNWLAEHLDSADGVWLVFGKNSALKTVRPDEALEEALCFGWIDGQIKSIDDDRYIKKFTPRRQGSKWSARNRELVVKLIESGKMTSAGITAIEQAKKSGTWEIPEASPVTDEHIKTFTFALTGAEPALTNFLKMPPSVRRTYTAFYFDAKQEETRKRRLQQIITRLNENRRPM